MAYMERLVSLTYMEVETYHLDPFGLRRSSERGGHHGPEQAARRNAASVPLFKPVMSGLESFRKELAPPPRKVQKK